MLKMKFDYILFDLDGTLTDPSLGITNSIIYALEKLGEEIPERESLYKFIGPPLTDSFCKFCGFSEEKAREGLKYYREYFAHKGIFENRPYDGIETALSNLHDAGKRLVLATSKPEVFAVKIMEHFNFAKYFSFIGGASMDDTRIRKGDVIEYALRESGVDPVRAVMVGDREYDILGAKDNGLKSMGVLFGFGSREELLSAGADFIAATVDEMREALLKM